MSEPLIPSGDPVDAVAQIRSELVRSESSRRERLTIKFVMAALGSLPWVGSLLSTAASIPVDEKAAKTDDLRTRWLEEHHRKLAQLQETLGFISDRFATLGGMIEERIQNEEYLALVRQSFRTWDRAETQEKRRYVASLLVNAAGTGITSDDVIRLFINWLDLYHEAHFAVMREVYRDPGITRYEMWSNIYGDLPREDSAEADLYRLLIRDLTTGGVIRQARDTNEAGQLLRRKIKHRPSRSSSTMESAFEDTKPYVLTELGQQFVHYAMDDVVQRLSDHSDRPSSGEGGGRA